MAALRWAVGWGAGAAVVGEVGLAVVAGPRVGAAPDGYSLGPVLLVAGAMGLPVLVALAVSGLLRWGAGPVGARREVVARVLAIVLAALVGLTVLAAAFAIVVGLAVVLLAGPVAIALLVASTTAPAERRHTLPG